MEAVERGLLPLIVTPERRRRMVLADRMAHYRVPGLGLAVISDYRIEWARGYGEAQAGGAAPVDRETLFQAASISKAVSAVGFLSLVERGLVGLDDDVNRWLTSWTLPESEFSKENRVTLRWLLSHRAGLTVAGFPGYPVRCPLPALPQILDGAGPANNDPVRVLSVPGSAFQYSGGGTTVVQQLTEDVTGQPFADFMRDTVLRPLGMRRSTYEQPLPSRLAGSAASGHRADGRLVPGRWHVYPELAAAGLWATPSDLARYAIGVQLAYDGRSERVLRQGTVREMLSAQGDGPVGLGPFVGGSGPSARFSHTGGNEGFRCDLIAHVHQGEGAVVMTNSDAGDLLAKEVLNAVADVYGWSDYLKEKTVASVDPAVYDRYAGVYAVGDWLTIEVRREGATLLGEAPGFGGGELLPESESCFFLPDIGVEISFVADEHDEVTGLVVRRSDLEFEAGKRSVKRL